MSPALVSRAAIIDTLLGLFRHEGYDGATMASISRATGLGRSSLYHHFPGGKTQMAEAVLGRLGEWLRERVTEPLADQAVPLDARVDALLAALDELYDGGRVPCLLERLSASVETGFRQPLGDAFGAWTDALAGLYRERGAPADTARQLAEDAIARIEGALVLSCATGTTGAFGRALEGLRATIVGRSGEYLTNRS